MLGANKLSLFSPLQWHVAIGFQKCRWWAFLQAFAENLVLPDVVFNSMDIAIACMLLILARAQDTCSRKCGLQKLGSVALY